MRTAILARVASSTAAAMRLELVDLGEAVVEAGAAEAVAVGDLDDLDAGRVEGVHDAADLLLGELVLHRVRAVAQGGVGDPQVALAPPAAGVFARTSARSPRR